MPPRTVLIVCLRRIGDVLLTTPLAVSIQAAWPGCRITWLVFEGTQGPLDENPAADEVITVPEGPGVLQSLRLLASLRNRFDLAVSAQSGDRPNWVARFASRRAFGLRSDAMGGFLRDALMTASARPSRGIHRIDQVLTLCEHLNIKPIRRVTVPLEREPNLLLMKPYWVLHPGAAFVYKQWSRRGWRELARHVKDLSLGLVVTGGTGQAETDYLDELFEGLSVLRLDGRLSWQELVWVLRRAQWVIGVDTSVTHLAAAVNDRVVPIFGPTDPRLWAPVSSQGAIRVLQHGGHTCQPCQLEGCDRHIRSHSKCLDELEVNRVFDFMRAET
jgi:heptosyltransferase III